MSDSPKSYSVLYQDADFIAVNKASGLLCVPGLKEPDNLFDKLRQEFPDARVVHRLDMPTSGIVLFALNYETQRRLSKLFEIREIKKHYHALIFGHLRDREGEIHSPLICDWPNRPKQKIDWLNGKHSSTFFTRLEVGSNFSRVALRPLTGRSHQLRLHMLQLGHPILGDAFYNRQGSQDLSERLMLHAETIEFRHPTSNKPIRIFCPAEF